MEMEIDEPRGGGGVTNLASLLETDDALERQVERELKAQPPTRRRLPYVPAPDIGPEVLQLHFSLLPTIVQRLSISIHEQTLASAVEMSYGYPKFFVPPDYLRVSIGVKGKDMTVMSAVRGMFTLRIFYQLYAHPCMDPEISPNGLEFPSIQDFANRTNWYGPSVRLAKDRPEELQRRLEDKVAKNDLPEPSEAEIASAVERGMLPVIPWDQIFTVQEIEDFMHKAVTYIQTSLMEKWDAEHNWDAGHRPKPYRPWDHFGGHPMPFEDRIRFHYEVEIAILRFYADVRRADVQPNLDDDIRLVWFFRCMEFFVRKMARIDVWHTLGMRGEHVPSYRVRAQVMAKATPSFKDDSYKSCAYEFYETSREEDTDLRNRMNDQAKKEREYFDHVQVQLNREFAKTAEKIDEQPSDDAQEDKAALAARKADTKEISRKRYRHGGV